MKHTWKIVALVFIPIMLIVFASYVPVQAQKVPPTIPHSLDGRADCNLCHATGVGSAPKVPPDHTGRTNEMCRACHQSAATTKPSTEPTAAPTAATKPATGGTPRIPHLLQNRENCLACHATGIGGANKIPANHTGRTNETCRGCHPSAAEASNVTPLILPTPIPHVPPTAFDLNSCVNCHNTLSGNLKTPVQDWESSIHYQRSVLCEDCHGGDATKTAKEQAHATQAGFIGKPNIVDIPALCASCHARVETMRQYDLPTDQWAKYQQSVHGIKLAQGDLKVATCFTCHDGHGTKKTNDPTSKVYPLNVPGMCAACHANVEYMKGYNIPTNQFALYSQSVHGQALLVKQDTRAPSCATCHGTHGAAPPGYDEVANVCGSCHTATQEYYLKSQHASGKAGTPKCVTCHGRYDVMQPTDELYVSSDTRACTSCHTPTSPQAPAIRALYDNIKAGAISIEDAKKKMAQAERAALIIAPEEAKLAEAKTNLITARAAQHTLDLTTVKDRTDKATAKAKEVIADSERAIQEEGFRRQVMGIGLVIMALAIASLYVIRRELYKQLPPE